MKRWYPVVFLNHAGIVFGTRREDIAAGFVVTGRRRVGFLMIFLGLHCLVATAQSYAQDEPAVTYERLLDLTTKWRESFVNIRVVYELRSLPPVEKALLVCAPPADPDFAPKFAEAEWIWADHGLDLFASRSFYWSAGQTASSNIDVFNGPKRIAFRASYEKLPGKTEEFRFLQIQEISNSKPISSFNRTALSGLYFPTIAEWLPERLKQTRWMIQGIESVLGDSCAKIGDERNGTKQTLWLDLQHDALPRRFQETFSTGTSRDFVVDELQQLDGGHWFPKSARMQLKAATTSGDTEVQNQLVIVTQVDVNSPLDPTRFDPPEPGIGTVIADGRTGLVRTHGPNGSAQDAFSSDIRQQESATIQLREPQYSNMWFIGFVLVSAVALVTGLWFRAKTSRSE